MRPIIYAGVLILLLIAGKIIYSSFSSDKQKNEAAPKMGKDAKPMKVSTLPLRLDNSDNVIYSSGTTVANEEVEIRSEISGKIVKLYFPEGSFVSQGQVIAKIKDDDILAQLKKLEIDNKLALQTEARQKKLLDINAISKEEYDISLNKTFSLNADKEILKVQLAKTVIKSPFSGKLGLKNISLGAYITPSNTIGTLTQYNPIKIDFNVPEKYLDQVKIGRNIEYLVEGKTQKLSAKIIAIDPKIDPNIRSLKIRAIGQNPSNELLPGMFIRVNLNLGSQKSIMVPSETIIPVLDGKKVFVKRNGMAQELKIETGLRNEGNVQVLSGLNVGDSLIISGLGSLKAGSAVISKN